MITIRRNHLAAALISAANKDVRHYINVVLFRVTADGETFLISTDGHRLFRGKFQAECTQKGPFDILIPRDAVKTALASRQPTLDLVALPDGRHSLGDTIFTPISGVFPDIERVIPAATSGEVAQFNWDYIVDARNQLRLWEDNRKEYYELKYNGSGVGTMSSGEDTLCCVMPVRIIASSSTKGD